MVTVTDYRGWRAADRRRELRWIADRSAAMP